MTTSATAQAVVLRSERYDSADAAAMITKAHAVNEELYGHPDQTPVSPDEFAPEEGGEFVVAYLNDVPIGCGGYRRHTDDPTGQTAEIKRMYVDPYVRRHGIAQQLLARLENTARNAGYRAAILDTGSKQAAAHALYEKCGYTRTAGFSIYRDKPGNRAYLKDLLGDCGDRRLDGFEDV